MNKSDRVRALISHFSNGNKAVFAAKLGLKPQSINNWIARDTLDAELVYSKCERVSADWLLSGEGDMLVGEHKMESKAPGVTAVQIQELTAIIHTQAKALLEQQRFINAHFSQDMQNRISPPLAGGGNPPDTEKNNK